MSYLSILLAIGLLVALYFWLRRRPRGRRGGTSVRRPPGPFSRPVDRTAPTGTGVDRRTQQQLLRLVNGSRPVALRLVSRIQLQNPGQSEQWCWEKAIYDIQRDRRA